MTPQELERRCRAVECWPEGLSLNTSKTHLAHALILAELMAKMPGGYKLRRIVESIHAWHVHGPADGSITRVGTPLEAALAAHEHARGIRVQPNTP